MNLDLINKEVSEKEHQANRLEGSILFLQSQPDNYKHQNALWLLEMELWFRRDQLFNYRVLVNLLKEEQSNEQVPEENKEAI